jgi:hypothetical protein
MEIHELMMLTDDEIDYNTLSDDELKELALGDELFIATSALGELENRNGNLGAEVAWEILSNAKGDRYLQAAALETFFQGNPELALDYMKEQAQKCDRYVLKTILELMIENSSDFQSQLASSVSHILGERIKNLHNQEDIIAPEVIDSFLSLYNKVENFQASNSATPQAK